jgi:glucokinase
MMKALAIDLGGTHATCAVLDDRSILAAEVVSTDGTQGLKPVLPLLVQTFRKLLQNAGVAVNDCAGLAFSFCGLADTRIGRVVSTNQKYDDAVGIDFIAWSKQEFGIPLRIENDARMALLGESYAGAARGFEDVVMTTLGTGIGGAAMIGGKLVRGKHAQAGCLGGHLPVLFNGRTCTCGNIGCPEAEAAGWSLPLVARDWPGYSASALRKDEPVNFEKLFRYAEQGDPVATALRDRCLRIWAASATGLIHAYDPEIVVYGGGVMKSADIILPFVQAYVEKHAWTPWGKVKVRAAELGNNAGLLGAIPLLSETIG